MDEAQALEQLQTNAILFTPGEKFTGVMVAYFLSEEVAAQLAALPGVETPPEEMHITLAYLGSVDDLSDTQVAHALLAAQQVANDWFGNEGNINGIGRFNASASSDGKDVIYAVVDVPGLDALRNVILDQLGQRGIPIISSHGFNPHVTLAYIDAGSPSPIDYVPTIPLSIDRLSVSVGGRKVDFPMIDADSLRGNTAQEEQHADTEQTAEVVTTGRVEVVANAQVAKVRKETRKGKTYLVSPAVPIRSGVLNGELVPAEEVEHFALAWNGRPMPLGHPKDGEGYISANTIDLWDSTPAYFFNAEAKDGALTGEVWFDVEKAKALGGQALQALALLERNQPIELSTAYFRDLVAVNGEYDGKPYSGIARNLKPDHIAILLDEPGACSWQDGCGTPRVNAAQSTADQTFLSAIVRRLIQTLSGGNQVKDQLVNALVANSRCKCSKEQLEALDEGTLQSLADTLAANEEVSAEATVPAQTEVVPQPVVAPLPQEVAEFQAFVTEFGGMDKIKNLLSGIAANADRERNDLVAALVANKQCTLGEDELKSLSVDTLRKLHTAFAPKSYFGNAGAIVSNRQEEDEFEVMSMPKVSKEGK